MTVDPALEANPDLEDVLQEDAARIVVDVKHDGPVSAHQLPARHAELFSVGVTETAQTVVGKDARRSRLVVVAETNSVRLSTRRTGIANGFLLPPGVPAVIRNSEALYAAADSTAVETVTETIVTALGTDPAAGAEITETVPAGQEWDLLAIRYTLVTSAVVATRAPSLVIDDGTNTILRIAAASTQAASLTVAYNWMADLGYEKASASANVQGSFPRLTLPAGYRIRTTTGAIDVGDNYSAPVLHYVRRTTAESTDAQLHVAAEYWAD